MALMTTTPLTDRLRTAPPDLHGDGQYWGLAWAALAWLETNAHGDWSTLEIGAGASTIVLAAAGCEHEAITPDPVELRRIRESCRKLGIDSSRVRGLEGLSHEILSAWTPRPLDLVLIDGAHGFPYPVLDWWYVAPHVKVGGHVLLDDAYLPAVGVIVDYVRQSPHWELAEAVSFRTAHVIKLSPDPMPFDADAHAAHGRMRFQYLPPGRRLVASARQRLFSTGPGMAAVEALRRRRAR
jgi:precorrin-6B methylase 2